MSTNAPDTASNFDNQRASLRAVISGNVQGVGYRRWAKATAQELGLSGWARNRSDGKVEALFHGDADHLSKFLYVLHQGPSRAQVSRVSSRPVSTVPQAGFRIRKTRTLNNS